MAYKKRLAATIGGGAMGILMVFVPWFEGTRLQPYQDAVGIWTVCTGHTGGVVPGLPMTEQQCDALLKSDLGHALETVDSNVDTPINETTRAALASFVFNVGEGAFKRSTLLKKLQRGDIRGACNELPRWVYAGGKRLRGLVRRRHDERELCLEGVEP